ncbi:hypothetical protein B0H11DRAFT_2329314 [Mycena galericulata]|nr:hypothetical protein B0H11DRAFT_2329314 [Mycena galericulata]
MNPHYFPVAVNILSLYSRHPTLFRISADTEVIFLVARLWCWRAMKISQFIPSTISNIFCTYIQNGSNTLDELCVVLGAAATAPRIISSVEWMSTQELASLNAGVSSTIALLLRTPTAEFASVPLDIDSIEAHLGMIVALSRAPRHTHAFINNHSPLILVKHLASLSNLFPTPAVARCVSLCVEHLCCMIENSPGIGPILETLGAMLLPILIKCYAHIPELSILATSKYDAAALLTDILSKYLIYISVRERVSKALEIIAATASEALLVADSPFAVAWARFKALAIQRMQIQERVVRLKRQIICSNLTACQVYDWKFGGHKESCSSPFPGQFVLHPFPNMKMESSADRKSIPIGNRDMRAADEAVLHDLELRLPEIRTAWATLRAAPVVVFDYTTNPLSFATSSVDVHEPTHNGSEQLALFWAETVGMVKTARKRGLDQGIIVVNIPYGLAPCSTYATVTLDELETTIRSGGPLFEPLATLCVG